MGILDKIYDWVLIFTFAIGFIVSIKHRLHFAVRILPFFILTIFCVEQYGGYLNNHNKPNVWLYNYFSTIQFCFYIWLISEMFVFKKAIKTFSIINVVYGTLALINILYLQGKTGFHTITYALGSLLVIITSIYNFHQILLMPDKNSLLHKTEFWVSLAVLFCYTCSFPIFCLNNIYYSKVSEVIWPIIVVITDIINIIFYLLFAVAFLCQIKIKKYLPSSL